MAEITFVLGAPAHWDGNSSGEVSSLVVDSTARRVTHLVVEPKGRSGLARLVPLDHVDQVDAKTGGLRLGCTDAEFEDLSPAEESLAEFDSVVLLPSQEPWRPPDDFPVADGSSSWPGQPVEPVDLVPDLLPNADEEHRGDHVHAADGEIGQLHALSVDNDTGKVKTVRLKRHLWGHKDIAIPIENVSGFDAGIHLNLTKHQVQQLTTQ
jgi:hypothetical protein